MTTHKHFEENILKVSSVKEMHRLGILNFVMKKMGKYLLDLCHDEFEREVGLLMVWKSSIPSRRSVNKCVTLFDLIVSKVSVG